MYVLEVGKPGPFFQTDLDGLKISRLILLSEIDLVT